MKYNVTACDFSWYENQIGCQKACPVHTASGEYVSLIAQKRYKEAYEVIRANNPLPLICSRICAHPCEDDCRRANIDEAVAIRVLKRFALDQVKEIEAIQPEAEKKEEKIAIVGSGPAGLTCAYYLALKGYQVKIFEKLPVTGGMLRVGIPEYRLPRQILDNEINTVVNLGVEIETNCLVGKDITMDELFSQGYKAIFLAVGAHKSQKLNIAGEDHSDVVSGVDFLRELNLGKEVKVGKRVAVIGGGNVALDSARSALRLGAEQVSIFYRRSEKEMPASSEEIEAARLEGIKIEYLSAPNKVLVDNEKLIGLQCIKMELGEPDSSGRRKPMPVEGSDFSVDMDMVITAIGQTADLSFLPADNSLEIGKGETLSVDPVTLATNRGGIFGGGDAVFGPQLAIDAIADGKKAADSIEEYLGVKREKGKAVAIKEVNDFSLPEGCDRICRQPVPVVSSKINPDFREYEIGYDEKAAGLESRRCLTCFINTVFDGGKCILCGGCVDICPYNALRIVSGEEIEGSEEIKELLSAISEGGTLPVTAIIKEEERCLRCGLCFFRCPTGAITMEYFQYGGIDNDSREQGRV